MYERPLHMKQLFDAVALFERTAFASQETQHTEAVRLPGFQSSDTEPIQVLPLDELCRPYLISFVKWGKGLIWDDTIYQVARLTEEYRRRAGKYPTEIVLKAERYFVRRCERFYPMDRSARPIPFRYESAEADYEILVRGKV